MPNSTSLVAYPDVEAAMEKALASTKGVRLTFKDRKAAFHFLGRCNSFRRLHRKQNRLIYPDPGHQMHGHSPFDVLVLRINENAVTIEPIMSEAPEIEVL